MVGGRKVYVSSNKWRNGSSHCSQFEICYIVFHDKLNFCVGANYERMADTHLVIRGFDSYFVEHHTHLWQYIHGEYHRQQLNVLNRQLFCWQVKQSNVSWQCYVAHRRVFIVNVLWVHSETHHKSLISLSDTQTMRPSGFRVDNRPTANYGKS